MKVTEKIAQKLHDHVIITKVSQDDNHTYIKNQDNFEFAIKRSRVTASTDVTNIRYHALLQFM